MNNMVYNKIICFFLLIFLCSASFMSCNKKLDIASYEIAPEAKHWESISDTKGGLLGIYGLLRSAMVGNNAHWIYGEVRMGDFQSTGRQDLEAVVENDLKKSFPLIEDLSNWKRFYAVINAANLFIERAPAVVKTDSRYTRDNLAIDVSQARLIRAFTYFYMVRIWGDVPLLTASFDNSGDFPKFKKTNAIEVLQFAQNELMEATEYLPFQYGVDNQQYYGELAKTWKNILFNKSTAYAIMAHIAAWQGKYIDVDAYTKFILDNLNAANLQYNGNLNSSDIGIDKLTGITGIFSNAYEPSQLFSISGSYTNLEASNTGHFEQLVLAAPFINKTQPDLYVSRDSITSIFQDLYDERFGFIASSGLYNEAYFKNIASLYPVFCKINIIKDGKFAEFGSNLIFTRLEEIVLLRAEALAAMGRTGESVVMLNRIKNMRKATPYSISMEPGRPLMDEIFKERRKELLGEGWRCYDLQRFYKLKGNPERLNQIASGQFLWPIASVVIKNNSEITQNEYWK